MSCCLDISDVELQFNRRIGYDVAFTLLTGNFTSDDLGNPISDDSGQPIGDTNPLLSFNPREGDYYTVEDDIATLHKVIGDSEVSDDIGGFVSDDTGGGISVPTTVTIYLRDADGNILTDPDGNPIVVN